MGVAVTMEAVDMVVVVATMVVAVTTTVAADMVVQARTTERTSSSMRRRLNGIYPSLSSLKNTSTRRAKSQLIDLL